MCLIAFAWKPDAKHHLVVAANRDEFHARPTAPLSRWDDTPAVAAGRDLQAGGSWMGTAQGGHGGRFAALTNFREMQQTPARCVRRLHAVDAGSESLSHRRSHRLSIASSAPV